MSKNFTPKKKPHTIKHHIKRGDTVMVIAGKDKGKTGVVQRLFNDKDRVLVEGINIKKKAVKPNPMAGQQGGIVEMAFPLHVSNVMVYDAKAEKPTRIKRETVKAPDGKAKRVRVSKVSGEQLDD